MEIQSIYLHTDLLRSCIEHMSSNGFPFDGSLECDGQLHRFSRDSNKNQHDEWYVCYAGTSLKGHPYLTCVYASWSDGGEKFTYKSYETNVAISHEERLKIRQHVEQKRKQLENDLKEEREKRIERAQEIWDESISTSSNKKHTSYLERKLVDPNGIKYRVERNNDHVIVIPLRNLEGKLQAVQCIHEDGTKRIYGVKKGNFHVLGNIEANSIVYITEGYATAGSVYKATQNPVVIAFDCGNLHSVISNLRNKYPYNKFIIAADNDVETLGNPGKTKAEEAAKAFGCSVTVPTFPQDLVLANGKKPTDFNDLHVHSSLNELRNQLQQIQLIERGKQTRNFQFRSAYSLIQEPPNANWLIKPYIDVGSLSMLYGEPGSMKSFLAIDMGCCIATGRAWHGYPVRKSGPVFYIAGEGFAGLSKRFRAWSLANNIDFKNVPFFSSDRPAQLLDQASAFEVVQAIDELKNLHGQPIFVIIDTLNRNFGPGDENSTADMTAFINIIDVAIRLRYGCAVLILHHTPLNDPKRARGSSALRGALDWEYCLTESGNTKKLSATKVKDYDPPSEIRFKPRSIQLDGWIDLDDAEVMTSCVLEKVNGNIGDDGSSVSKLQGQSKIAFDCLTQLSESRPEGVHIDDWRSAAYQAGISSTRTPSANKKAFKRAVDDLKDKSLIQAKDNYWRIWETRDRDGTFEEHVANS